MGFAEWASQPDKDPMEPYQADLDRPSFEEPRWRDPLDVKHFSREEIERVWRLNRTFRGRMELQSLCIHAADNTCPNCLAQVAEILAAPVPEAGLN